MSAENRTRRIAAWALALVLAAIFGVSGGWKLYDPASAARQQVELGMPLEWATIFVVFLGSLEFLAAVLILTPSFRRPGTLLAAALTVSFIVYLGMNYGRVKGKECGCLPGRQRSIGVGFFIEDGLLLAAAVAGAALSRRTTWTARRAVGAGAALALLAGMGWASSRLDKPLFARREPLVLQMMDRSARFHRRTFPADARLLLYFENPSCGTCLLAAQALGKLSFKIPLIVLPDSQLQSSYRYLDEVGLREAEVSTDHEPLSPRLDVKLIPSLYVMDGTQARAVIVEFNEPDLSRRLREFGALR